MKEFLPYNVVRNNALKLGWQIYNSGFFPDVIYVSLRGGAYLGNVLSEYFKFLRKGERPVFYAAVVAHSYLGPHQKSNIRIDGWTYSPEHLRVGDKILFVDDIFDSGETLNHLVKVVLKKGIPEKDIKVAVHDYKYFTYKEEQAIKPDFYCRKLNVENEHQEKWIHYLSHELIGLTPEECEKQYFSEDDDPQLRQAMSIIMNNG